jgi:hypothetical protein
MSRRLQENIVILFLLAFFVAVLIASYGYGPRARLVPVPIAILGIVLVAFQFAWQNFRAADTLNIDLLEVLTRRGDNPDVDAAAEPEPPAEKATRTGEGRRMAVAFGMVALFVTMTLAIGPIPTIFLFTGAYFVLSGHFRPGKAVLWAGVFAAATYLVFVQVLQLQLYNGYLTPVAEFLRRLTHSG